MGDQPSKHRVREEPQAFRTLHTFRKKYVRTEKLHCFSWMKVVTLNLEQSLYSGHRFGCQGIVEGES